MKTKWTFLLCAFTAFSAMATAQTVSADSISTLNREKEKLTAALSLTDNKLKLAALQNQLAEQTYKLQLSNEASQKAADTNQEAANTLSADSQDKEKAKDAKKTAAKAEDKTKAAGKAQVKIDKLNKHIEEQQRKVSDDEQKLAAFTIATALK